MRRLRTLASLGAATLSLFMLTACGGEPKTVTEETIREHLIAMTPYEGETKEVTAAAFCADVLPQYQKYGNIVTERAQFESNQDATPEQLYGNLVAQQEVVQGMEDSTRGSKITDDETLETLRTDVLDPSSNLITGYNDMKAGKIGLNELDPLISQWESSTTTMIMYCAEMPTT